MTKDEAFAIGVELGPAVAARELATRRVDHKVVGRLVADGRVHQLWRGMYVFGALHDVNLASAAYKHAQQRQGRARPQPEPLVTGLAVCRMKRHPWVPGGTRVQVLVGDEVRRPSYEAIEVRRTAGLSGLRRWKLGEVALASEARAVYDGARLCTSLRDTRGLVLGAIARRTPLSQLQALRDAGGGTAWFNRAVRDAERGCASPPEAELVDCMVGCGRPFYVNPLLYLDDVLLCSPDVFIVGTGSGGELDSIERHFEDDDDRNATLDRHTRVAAHIELLHRTPTRFRRDPPFMVRELFAQADRRLAQGLGDPPGLRIVPRGPLLR